MNFALSLSVQLKKSTKNCSSIDFSGYSYSSLRLFSRFLHFHGFIPFAIGFIQQPKLLLSCHFHTQVISFLVKISIIIETVNRIHFFIGGAIFFSRCWIKSLFVWKEVQNLGTSELPGEAFALCLAPALWLNTALILILPTSNCVLEILQRARVLQV